MYPDQSLYAVDSVPTVVERINNTFTRADEIQWSKGIDAGRQGLHRLLPPIVADAEAGFGGVLNAFELMKAMITRRRRRRALRRPAGFRQEVRPHGWQGAGADRTKPARS